MRAMSADLAAAMAAPTVMPVYLVELDFVSTMIRAHSWIGDLAMSDPITGDDMTFTGVGDLGRIAALEQPDGLRASDMQLELTGLDSESVARAFNEDYQGRPARMFMSAMGSDGVTLAGGGGVTLLRGRMDVMTLNIGATASITLTIRNELADWERPVGLRYSDAAQRRLFPNDTGLSRMAFAAENTITWQV